MAGDLRDLMHGAAESKRQLFASEDFAGGYGRTVVGRVKRRRAVSATAVGGASAVAVGAIAVGASNMPWNGPGPGPDGPASPPTAVCTTSTPDAVPGSVATVPEDATYAIIDNASGAVFFAAFVDDLPTSWNADGSLARMDRFDTVGAVLTLPSGATVVFDEDDATSLLTMTPSDGAAVTFVEAQEYAAQAAEAASTTPDPLVTCVTTTPEPGVSDEPGAAASPFQCGYELDAPTHESPGLRLEDLQWLSADEAEQAIIADNQGWPADLPRLKEPVFSASAVPGVELPGNGQRNVEDPLDALPTLPEHPGQYFYLGLSVVGVSNGKVTATVPFDSEEQPGLYLGSLADESDFGISLLDDNAALVRCDALSVWDDVYVVAGVGVADVHGWVLDPIYAWAEIPDAP
jgi:hypothetical protein